MAEIALRLRRLTVAWLGKLLAVRDTPQALARGLAVGFFFGVSPLWGLQIVSAVAVAHLLRGNKIIAAALTAVSNPLTSLPLYGLCYGFGQLILGGSGRMPDLAQVNGLTDLWALGPHFFLAMLVGTTLVGVVGALILYFSASRIFPFLHRWHSSHRKAAPSALGRSERGSRAPTQPGSLSCTSSQHHPNPSQDPSTCHNVSRATGSERGVSPQ